MSKRNSRYELGSDRTSRVLHSLSLIEDALEPLIVQAISPLTPSKNQQKKINIFKLVETLVNSIDAFINCSEQIFKDYGEINSQILIEIEKLRSISRSTIIASNEFAASPSSSEKRTVVVKAARVLLSSVSRIMAIADMLDSRKFLRIKKDIERNLAFMQSATSQEEMFKYFKQYGECYKELVDFTYKTIKSSDDIEMCHKIAEARSVLTKQNIFLYTSSKAVLQFPRHEIANSLKDKVFKEVYETINKLDCLVNQRSSKEDRRSSVHSQSTNKSSTETEISTSIFESINRLEKIVQEMNQAKLKEKNARLALQNQIDETIKHITKSIICHSSSKLMAKCTELSDAFIDLFSSYEKNMNTANRMSPENFNKNKSDFIRKINSIKRLLRKLMLDQFTLQRTQPIAQLIEAALIGTEQELNEKVENFSDYACRLIEASYIACSLSNDSEGVHMVQSTIMQLKILLPEIIYSARLLCCFPSSPEAYKNMLAYKEAWLRETELLLLTVDDIIDINDFLAVSEGNILEDINACISSVRDQNHVALEKYSADIASRANRVCDLVTAEMDNYEPCEFTHNVIGTAYELRTNVLTNFSKSVKYASDAMVANPIRDPNENDLIDASRLIYDGVRDMRNAIFLINSGSNSNQSELDSEPETDPQLENQPTVREVTLPAEAPLATTTLTAEQRANIETQLESFSKEKTNFEREVLKWDDKSNDIVVLAKQMCLIIMNMTDFMLGKGPFTQVQDIIKAAKQISGYGTKLDKLVSELAEQCPESKSKQELLGYLKRLPLFCNQLSLGSKVKEYTFDPDSASSLIISSKNLMSAVMAVVQTSYVASTKYTSKTSDKKPIVQWKMKPPEKKPLIQKAGEKANLVRKASQKKKVEAAQILSEFQV